MTEITDNSAPEHATTMNILSLDPGTDNFGFAVLKISRRAARIVRCGMIDETIKDLKDAEELQADAGGYTRRLAWLLKKSRAQRVAAERYVPRRQGLSNESVNMMIGTTVSYCSALNLPVSLFLAATWKLRVKKFLVLEDVYALVSPVPNHVVDAVFIGLFDAEKQGLLDLSKFSASKLKALCKDLRNKYLDLRTGERKARTKSRAKKRRPKRSGPSSKSTRAPSRRKR